MIEIIFKDETVKTSMTYLNEGFQRLIMEQKNPKARSLFFFIRYSLQYDMNSAFVSENSLTHI